MADTIQGTAGADSLDGALEADIIEGLEGNDTLRGYEGGDTLEGGPGEDWLYGGTDSDLMSGDSDNDTVFGEEGSDTLDGGAGNDYLRGFQDDDILSGSAGNDVLNGNMGDDTVSGGEGNDIVRGGKGNDNLFGDAGDDILFGGTPSDSLPGTDTLTGGDGNDTFILRKDMGAPALPGADIITDFGNSADIIRLADGLTFEDLNISQGTGSNVGDTIIEDKVTGEIMAVLVGVDSSTIDRADFTVPGTLEFSAPTFRVNEDGTPVQAVTVTRAGGSDGAVSATAIFGDDSAKSPQDYNSTPVTVNFADGDAAPKTVTVPIVDDTEGEFTETTYLALTNLTGGASLGTQSLAVLQIADNDDASTPKLTLRNPIQTGASTYDTFGYSIAAVGNNVLIGEPSPHQMAYLFDGSTGEVLRGFYPPNQFYSFGSSVASVGNSVLIADPTYGQSYSNNTHIGAAYLFDAITGELKQTFLNPSDYGGFGTSLAAAGNNVATAARSAENNDYNAVVFLFDATTGALKQTFRSPHYKPEKVSVPNFGQSLAFVGNNILIGETAVASPAVTTEAVYLYDTITGELLQTFLNPTPNEIDQFGQSVAAVGNSVLIGAPSDDTGGSNAGAAYLFDATTGALLQTFLSPSQQAGNFFGQSVAAAGNNVLIGAPGYDAAYLFDATTGALVQTLLTPTSQYHDDDSSLWSGYGYSLAANGENIFIGVKNLFGAGEVYMF